MSPQTAAAQLSATVKQLNQKAFSRQQICRSCLLLGNNVQFKGFSSKMILNQMERHDYCAGVNVNSPHFGSLLLKAALYVTLVHKVLLFIMLRYLDYKRDRTESKDVLFVISVVTAVMVE